MRSLHEDLARPWPDRHPFAVRAVAIVSLALASLLSACDSRAPQAAGDQAAAASAASQSTAQAGASQAAGNEIVVANQPQTRAQVYAAVKKMTALGKQMFFDPALSGSGKLACASCHSPDHAFGSPNGLSVQLGGDDLHQQGFRAVPTLMYLQKVPPFTRHFHDSDEEGDESVDAGPTGGLTWDGRVDRGEQQARIPLTTRFEMNSTPAKVASAVRAARYLTDFRATFGDKVLSDDMATFNAVLQALGTYEQTPEVFTPYTSKYDAFLDHKARLTAAEMRGLELFNDERKGNCASCHISQRALDGSPPQFSDFGLIALGVPRNRELAVNKDPKFHDLGACGPERQDLKGEDEFCGIFRTPTLRNVVLKKAFFHNGIYHSLDEVLRFYVQRDTNPERFYPVRHGVVQKYDDLPKRYWANINTDPPFDRKRGEKPALSEAEIQDVIAFLHTLTDGYRPDAQQQKVAAR